VGFRVGGRPLLVKQHLVAALVRGQADAANQGVRIPCEGGEGEAAGGHAQVKDGRTAGARLATVHRAWDGEARGGEVELEANAPHELEEARLELVVRVVGAGSLVLEPGVPGGRIPALELEVYVSFEQCEKWMGWGHELTCPLSEASSW